MWRQFPVSRQSGGFVQRAAGCKSANGRRRSRRLDGQMQRPVGRAADRVQLDEDVDGQHGTRHVVRQVRPVDTGIQGAAAEPS